MSCEDSSMGAKDLLWILWMDIRFFFGLTRCSFYIQFMSLFWLTRRFL